MSAQRASGPVRLAAFAAAAVLVVLAAVLIVRLAGRREPARPSENVGSPPEGRTVDLKERVRHEEYEAGRLVAVIRGDKFFLGPDGRNHLRGSVEVVTFGPAGETVSRLAADEVAYAPGSSRFSFSGHVRVAAGGVVLEGDGFDYDKTGGTFGTSVEGRFASKTMTGRAKGLVYSESAGEIRLGGGFEAVLAAPGEAGKPIVLSGASLSYRSGDRRGRVDGQAAFSDGRIRGSSSSLSFTAAGDESALDSALFEGQARVDLAGPDREAREGGSIAADKVDVSFRRGLVSSAEAEGSVVFSLQPPAGPSVRVRAGSAKFSVGPDGTPGDWAASGGVTAEIGPDGDGGMTAVASDSTEFAVATGILRAGGQAGRPAVAESAGIRIEAPLLTVGPAAGDLAASEGVRCVFKPGQGDRTAGFFSAGEEAFVTADRLVRMDGTGIVAFAGTVRAWQGGESVSAGELEISGDGEGMRAGGGVSAALVLSAAAAGPERHVEIGGAAMEFSAAGRALSFEGRSYVQLSGARLEARSVSAVLAPGARAVASLSARTDVVLSKGRYEGRGAAAAYEAASDRLVLTGKPVLTDGKGTAARGDKLTFDLADDKILLENEGQGRTTTVVKS